MTISPTELRKLLELYADGELPDADRPLVEQQIATNPAAAEYLAALDELSLAVRMPVEHAVESVAFDGLFDRVMADIDAHQGAVEELGDLVRAHNEHALAAVDFGALHARVNAELDGIEAARASEAAAVDATEPASLWARVRAFFGPQGGLVASAVTAMLVAVVAVPLLSDGNVEIHNHYPIVDSVAYEKGYSGTVVPQGTKAAGDPPVVWFEPAEGSAGPADAAAANAPAAAGSGDADGSGTAAPVFQKGDGGGSK